MNPKSNCSVCAWKNVLSILSILSFCVFVSGSVIKVENGVYKGITVKVNDEVSSCHCDQIIENIQKLLTSTSRSLYEATKFEPGLNPGQFSDVTIILPGSWEGTECLLGRNISTGRNRYPFSTTSNQAPLLSGVNRPDFIVSGDSPIFGDHPSVNEQFGECGKGGKSGVNIPYKVLTQSLNVTKDSEIETFKEWLRYRYGVFPETGFAGDSIYPNQYEFGGEMRDSIGCKEVATKMKKPSQSFKTEYGFETSPTGSHVTVPFLPNEETNDNRPHLKLEEFTSPSFKGVEIGDGFVGKLTSYKKALCDVDLYDYNAPTKQNILCNRKSVREILRDHPDFLNKMNYDEQENDDFTTKIRNKNSFDIAISHEDNENIENETIQPEYLPFSTNVETFTNNVDNLVEVNIPAFVPPTFSLVLPSRKRYILVLDVSKRMGDENGFDRRWEKTRNALFRFIEHIKEGDEVGIISFGTKARQNIKATVVTNANREGLFGRVPFKLQSDMDACISCALQMVEKMISSPSSADGLPVSSHVVIVSGSHQMEKSTNKQSDELTHFKELIEMRNIPLYNVVFDGDVAEDIRQLAVHGENYLVPRTQNSSLLQNLADIFISILNLSNGSNVRKAYERYFFWEARQGETQISGNFVVEENLRNNLWMILTTPNKEDVDYFEVTSPSGAVHVLPVAENGIVYFQFKKLSEAGIWSYKVKLHPFSFSSQPVAVSIEVFGEEATDTDGIKVEGWTSVESKLGSSPFEKPIIIYAKVKQGELPVRGAEVKATVYRPDFSTPFEVTLADSGTGYPDITSGDGIYSAYFTGFTAEPGLYSLIISVNNDADTASVPKLFGNPLLKDNAECCGSTFGPLSSVHDSLPTGQFQRKVVGPSFYVNEGVEYYKNENGDLEVRDIFPPSRITDLSLMGYVNGTLYATLKWSSPGGDYDQNKASRYEIRKYTNPNMLTAENFEHGDILIPVHESLLPIPADHAGKEQSATVGLPWANEIFYYAIIAIDEAGNRGEVSNIVPVYAEEIITSSNSKGESNGVYNSDGTETFTTAVFEAFNSHDIMIYIVAGIVCGLLLIVSIIIIVSCCRCRRRANEKKKKQDQAHQRTQSFVNDLEANCQGSEILPPPSSEKKPLNPLSYSDVWMTQNSGHNLGLPSPHVNMDIDEDGSNHTPTSDELLMYNGNSQQPSVSNSSNYHSSHQQWRDYYNQTVQSTSPPPAYHSENGTNYKGHHVAPVHQYRLGSSGGSGSYREDPTIALGETEIDGTTPTYQNWTKPPSDNGTATTSSTECTSSYETDLLEKNKSSGNNTTNNQYLNGVSTNVSQPHHTPDAYSVHVPPTSLATSNGRRYSEDLSNTVSPMSYHQGSSYLPNGSSQFMDPASLSLSPSFCTNVKRKRNESLV